MKSQKGFAAGDLPVSIDFEGGYAARPQDVSRNVERLLDTGIVGINFEDRIVAGDGLYDSAAQSERIAAIRRAADGAGIRLFINARTDLFLSSPPDEHLSLVDEALARAHAYGAAGADGFFIPGLCDEQAIAQLAGEVRLPVNVMATSDSPPTDRLAALRVARISHGPGPYRLAMEALASVARQSRET